MIADFADVLKTLFWFVAIIIWIVSQFRKQPGKKGKSLKPGDNQRNLKDKKHVSIRDFFKDIANMQSGQERILSQHEEPTEAIEIIHPESLVKESRRATSEKNRPAQKLSDGEEIRIPRSPVPLSLSRRNLQQAVVFSEILAPPIALRDEGRGGSPNLKSGPIKNDEGASAPHVGNRSPGNKKMRDHTTLWQQLAEE